MIRLLKIIFYKMLRLDAKNSNSKFSPLIIRFCNFKINRLKKNRNECKM